MYCLICLVICIARYSLLLLNVCIVHYHNDIRKHYLRIQFEHLLDQNSCIHIYANDTTTGPFQDYHVFGLISNPITLSQYLGLTMLSRCLITDLGFTIQVIQGVTHSTKSLIKVRSCSSSSLSNLIV